MCPQYYFSSVYSANSFLQPVGGPDSAPPNDDRPTILTVSIVILYLICFAKNTAQSGSYNWNKTMQNKSKTNPKQNNIMFQRYVHVKQNAETKQK